MVITTDATYESKTDSTARFIINGTIKGSIFIPLETFDKAKKGLPKKVKIKIKI